MKKYLKVFFFFILYFFSGWSMAGHGLSLEMPAIKISPHHLPLEAEVALWVDPHAEATFDQVLGLKDQDFRRLEKSLSAGYTREVQWLRVKVTRRNDLAAASEWLLELRPAYLDDVRFFAPDAVAATGYTETHVGDLQPFSARPVAHRFLVFPLHFAAGNAEAIFYLRLQSTSTVLGNLSIYERNAFNQDSQGEYLALGLQLGAMLAMLLYSLLHWRLLGGHYLFLFSGLLISIAVATFGIAGLASQFLFPKLPKIANLFAPMGTCLFTFFGLWFYLEFFKIWERYRWFARFSMLTMALSAVGFVGVFLDFYVEVAPAIMLASMVSMPYYLVIVWRSIGPRFFGGRWIALAHTWFCVVMTANQMTVTGLLSAPAWVNDWHYNSLVYLMLLMSGVVTRVREVERLRDLAVAQTREAQLKAEAADAQREEKSKFLSLIGHELKTPLATIDAAVQALGYMVEPEDAASASRYQRIRGAVKKLNTLLEDALHMARNEKQQLTMSERQVLIHTQELANDLRTHGALSLPTVSQQRVEVHLSWQGTLCADSVMLRRALTNLIDNAIKYGPADAIIRVEGSDYVQKGQQGVIFTVKNALQGDPQEDCEAWFGQYARGTSAHRHDGLGLGLYLVRAMAQAHRGDAWCEIRALDQGNDTHHVCAMLWLPTQL